MPREHERTLAPRAPAPATPEPETVAPITGIYDVRGSTVPIAGGAYTEVDIDGIVTDSATGAPVAGAIFMALFGAGTLPVMLGMSCCVQLLMILFLVILCNYPIT